MRNHGEGVKSQSDPKSPSLGVWLFLVQSVTVKVEHSSDVKQRPKKNSWKETAVGFGQGSLYGISLFHPCSPVLMLHQTCGLWGMSTLTVDPETQADLQWNANQSASRPGAFGSAGVLNHFLWFLIRRRLSFSPLSHSQCQFQVYFLHHHHHQSYAGMANANTMTWKPW